MSKIDLGQSIGILANLGVIAGIIFLAVEIRQVGEQFELDRGNASADRLNTIVARMNDWAQLVATNSRVWHAGALGQALEPEDYRIFEAMAAAWERDHWTMWRLPTIVNSAVDPRADLQRREIEMTALELHENPGLLSYWRGNAERLTGGEFRMLIEDELSRLAAER